MPVNSKHVFFVKKLAHPSYADIVAKRQDVTLEKIENDSDESVAAPVLARAHVYQIGSTRDELVAKYHARAELLARAPNLLAVSTHGAGYDTIDLAACTAAGVLVVNQAGGNREAVAEHVMAMMLLLSKRIVETDRAMRRADGIERNAYMGNDVWGKTIGIVGLGHIGTRVAELCRGLFKMSVLAYDPYLDAAEIERRGAAKVELDALLARADIVSINCPRTAETQGMIGAREYALMQRHAFFITTARGGIHDEVALAAALEAKRLAGAGLDVWGKEPPPRDHPLLRFDNVVISPHTAGVTHEARRNIAKIAAEQVLEILDGKRPPRILNPEVWPGYVRRFERILGFAPRG
jgi:D-3-phosphoglycerate dehydrogenase